VLVLLPEIALSAQWLERFEARFGCAPALWHSELTPARRRQTWRAVSLGQARVVVGARSALFLPYSDLGLIVVDEEHDSAFKQEDGVIYQARDMAVVRARLGDIPIVLASATPSLETITNVKQERYERISLPDRHGGADLPEIRLVDLRRHPPPRIEGHGQSWISRPLREALAATLESEEQALLFLNRRGYAPLTLCRTCGHRINCPNCTAWLVEHRHLRRLQCHHCGYWAAQPETCPACQTPDSLAACGPGVERLAEEIAKLFPLARVRLVASDTLTGPSAAAELYRAIRDRDVDILIGTQVLAKGHHFPGLTLVGVVEVEPEHPVMQALASGTRDTFYEIEAEQRERAGMPPFGRLAALILSSPDPEALDALAADLARTAPKGPGIQVLGPAPAPLAVLRGRHRRRFLFKSRRDTMPQGHIAKWLAAARRQAAKRRGGGKVRIQVDIDPYSFL
jgi:primosomal protein N' (replication factor Y)